MTACVNKNHGRRVAGVVTASLVGALTLGGVSLAAVPTVALAEQGADLQFGTADKNVVTATDVTFTVGNGTANLGKHNVLFNNVLFKWNGTPTKVGVKSFKPQGSNTTITLGGNDAAKNYRITVSEADDKGDATSAVKDNTVVKPGKYQVKIEVLSDAQVVEQTYTANFTVSGKDLGTVTAKPSSSTFTGNSISVKYNNGADLTEGEDFTVTYTKQGEGDVKEVKGHGTYTAKLTGTGEYEGSTKTVSFTISPFDAWNVYGDTASAFGANNTIVEVAPYSGNAPTNPTSVYDYDASTGEATAELSPSLVTLTTDGDPAPVGSGENWKNKQSFKVSFDKAAVDAGDIVTRLGATDSTYGYVADYGVTFKLGGKDLEDSYTKDVTTDLFNTGAITAVSDKQKFTQKTDDTNDFTVRVTKAVLSDGTKLLGSAAQSAFDANETGTYTLQASLYNRAKEDGKSVWYAGSKTFTVKYLAGTVDADSSLFVYYDANGNGTIDTNIGESFNAITSFSKAYDGQPLTADNFIVGGSDEYGQAYTDLKKTLLDKDGNEVKSVKDAGTYTLKVTSDKYALSGTTELPITIAKVDLTSAEVGKLELWNDVSGEQYLPLNKKVDTDGDGKPDTWRDNSFSFNPSSDAIDALALVYKTGNEADSSKGADDPKDAKFKGADLKGLDALPDNVGVAVEHLENGSWKPVSGITAGDADAEGQYRVTLTVNAAEAANYVLPEGKTQVTLEFNAYFHAKFSDVQPSDWFYKVVNQAAQNEYMNGYQGTTTFGPNDVLTRGQVASVLYNMSGASLDETDVHYNKDKGWETGFSDVDGTKYYGKTIYWAKSTGVVNGYGDGTFHPDQAVSREELAAMLSNYAKVVNRDTTVDSADQSVLSKFDDASGVSDWAKGAVAWAVQNKVIGNGGFLNAGAGVTRAEAAAMAVNYQPKAK